MPERLIVSDALLWTRAPIPAGFGWWRQGWFPRSTLLGLPHPPLVDDPQQLPEVASGWIDSGTVSKPAADLRFQSGASPGMRFDGLAAGIPIELHGFAAEGTITTSLTAETYGRHYVRGRSRSSSATLSRSAFSFIHGSPGWARSRCVFRPRGNHAVVVPQRLLGYVGGLVN